MILSLQSKRTISSPGPLVPSGCPCVERWLFVRMFFWASDRPVCSPNIDARHVSFNENGIVVSLCGI